MTVKPTDNLLADSRRDRAALVAELESAGVSRWEGPDGRRCLCPFHSDRSPSGEIFQGGDGGWRYKCFPCGIKAGDFFDLRARRLNKPLNDVIRDWRSSVAPARPNDPERRHARLYPDRESLRRAACYQGRGEPPLEVCREHEYADPDTGEIDVIVFRLWDDRKGRKQIRQASPTPGGWVLRHPEGRWPLYNRTRLRSATHVVVVEGEGCVEALTPILGHLGRNPDGSDLWAATTNLGGGEKGRVPLVDWNPAASKRSLLWPDNDPPDAKTERRVGHEHMREVAAALQRLSPSAEVSWLDPAPLDLPPKGDAADWVASLRAAGLTDAQIAEEFRYEVVGRAKQLRASAPLAEYYADVKAGKLKAVPWPWPLLTSSTRSLKPGFVTMVCGEPGVGKSFLLVECLWNWLHAGFPPACLMLELSARFHAQRLNAQLAGESRLLDEDWIEANPAEVDRMYESHAGDIDRFWSLLDTVPADQPVTALGCCDWLEGRLRQGARVAVIDPITAIADDQPWVTDPVFLRRARGLCERYAASLVLTNHPDRGGRKMARSEAVRRFVDTVFWVYRHPNPGKRSKVWVRGGTEQHGVLHRLTVKVTKARLSTGQGDRLAYDFCPVSLRFAEMGLITSEPDEPSASDHEGAH
jgi:hypothetical protein